MIVETIDSDSSDFPRGSEFDFSDFITWLHLKMLPDHYVFMCFGKYWRVKDNFVFSEDEQYSAPEFALYRGRLGMTEEEETKAQILLYIMQHNDVRYKVMAKVLNVSNACVGYHISDLKARGLVDTNPLAITDIGEMALVYLLDRSNDGNNDNRWSGITIRTECDAEDD